MRWVRSLLVVLCSLSLPLVASAQGADEAVSDEQRAVEMFQISERLYSEGRYDQALQYLQQAHALRPSPTLLYNMARTNEKLDRLEDAISAYEQFLGTTTEPGEREQAELRIRTLRAELAERQALRDRRQATQSGPVTTEPETPQSSWADGWNPDDPLATGDPEPVDDADSDGGGGEVVPWILIGTGVPMMGIGLVLYVVATGKHDEAVEAKTSQKAARELQSEGEDLMLAGNILVGLGAAVAATGGVLLAVELAGDDGDVAQRSLRPVVAPGYLGVTGNF